jgi:hypothetical protein
MTVMGWGDMNPRPDVFNPETGEVDFYTQEVMFC